MKRVSVMVLVMVMGLVFTLDAYDSDHHRDGGYAEPVWKLWAVNGKAGLFVGVKGKWLFVLCF